MLETAVAHGIKIQVSGHASDPAPAGHETVKSRFFNRERWTVFMALPDNITADLAALDAGATTTATAISNKAQTASAASAADAADTVAGQAVTAAQQAQAALLAKTIADLNATYGTATPTT